MSMPLALMLRKGYTHSARIGTVSVTADQNNFLPVSEANWATQSEFRISGMSGVDRIVTGFEADGVRTLGGVLHPAAFKRFIMDFGPNIGLLLRHLNGSSLSPNRLRLPGGDDLLLAEGDTFSMTWDNPDWRIRDVSRTGLSADNFPTTLGGDETDYSPTGWRVADQVFIDGGAADRIIHSLAADDGALPSTSWLAHKNRKRIWNEGSSNNITFPNESATGTPVYKIRTFSGGSVVLAPNNFVDAYYDTVISRWRMG